MDAETDTVAGHVIVIVETVRDVRLLHYVGPGAEKAANRTAKWMAQNDAGACVTVTRPLAQIYSGKNEGVPL